MENQKKPKIYFCKSSGLFILKILENEFSNFEHCSKLLKKF